MLSLYLREWKDAVGNIAVIVTVLQFLSGAIVCLKYMKNHSTGDTSGFSFICGFLSCNLWLKYGMLKHDFTVSFVNSIGACLFFAYILIYFRYVTSKATIIIQFLCICFLLGIFHLYLALESNPLNGLHTTGFISCVVTLVFIASPLTMLLHVIKARSTETLPFPIILTSFFVSALWFIYGSIVEDTFMEIPNAIGAALSAFQLALFLIFPSKGSSLPQYSKLRQVV